MPARTELDRLAAARPPIVDHPEWIVGPAAEDELLRQILATAQVTPARRTPARRTPRSNARATSRWLAKRILPRLAYRTTRCCTGGDADTSPGPAGTDSGLATRYLPLVPELTGPEETDSTGSILSGSIRSPVGPA